MTIVRFERPILGLAITIITMSITFRSTSSVTTEPKPKPWPEQFHAVLVMNNTKTTALELIDLYYDWPNGRNLNLIQRQLNPTRLYDVEWNNGTSFYFSRDGSCRTVHFEVGILRPDWLVDGSTYLGQRHVDGFLCNVWEKADFIRYYEDVDTQRPVHWLFSSGRGAHVMTFEEGAVLEDSQWQAPVSCFDKHEVDEKLPRFEGVGLSLLRPPASLAVV